MKYYILFYYLVLVSVTSTAQESGQLDNSFGNAGIARFDFKPTTQFPPKVALQNDGSIITYMQLNFDTLIVYKFSSDGVLDMAFGINGSITTTGFRGISSIGLQKNNSIIVFGSVNDESVIKKFTPEGKVDSSFGENGLVTYTFGGVVQSATDFAIIEEDKIITVGTFSQSGNNFEILVARFNPDGSVDSSFGEEKGKTIIDRASYAQAVAFQKNGSIIVGGSDAGPSPSCRFMLARLTSEGIVDSSFGNNGISFTDFDEAGDIINSIAIQPDDKIVVAGVSLLQNMSLKMPYMAIARYLSNGVLDKEFGIEGKIKQRFDDYAEAFGVVLQNNSKIVVSGFVSKLAGNAVLTRYHSTGKIDSSFGDNGISITDFGTNQDKGYDLVIQPSGRIVVRCTPGLILAGYTNEDKLSFISKIKRWIRNHILNFSDANGSATQYNIEQQNSGGGFSTIASVLPNTNNSYSYDISNNTSTTTNSNFRIKAVYADGSIVYSDVVTQSALQTSIKPSIYPNPASTVVTINSLNKNKNYHIIISNKEAQPLLQTAAKSVTQKQIDIAMLKAGIYFIELKDDAGGVVRLKLVKE